MNTFSVVDTTLRDGQQNPEAPEHGKYGLTIEERLEIFTALVNYGVKYIEVFSPLVNSAEAESVAAIISKRNELSKITNANHQATKSHRSTHHLANQALDQSTPQAPDLTQNKIHILAHVRCDEKDIQAAINAGVDGLNVYMGTSQASQKFNHGKTLDEVAKKAKDILQNVRKQYPKLHLRFSGEDAFRTPLKDLFKVYDGISDTVDWFGMPDTVGVATPSEVRKRVIAMKKCYPNVGLEGHFHNDRGFSMINSVTAVIAGMDYMDTSVLGLAERSGITSLTGLMFNLYLENPRYVENFAISNSYPLNVLVASIMKMQVPYTEPVSLTSRTHSAGVHGGAMLKSGSVYEAHPLEKFGVTETRLLLGPLSGWHIVNYYLSNVLNYENITDEVAKEITTVFKNTFGNTNKKESPTEILHKLARSHKLIQKTKPKTHVENL